MEEIRITRMERPEADLYGHLPRSAKESTFVAGNGELAFRQEDLDTVASMAIERGILILGGEAWLVDEDGSITAVIPQSNGSSGVLHWEFEADGEEPWLNQCQSAARLMLDAVRDLSKVDIDWRKANGYRLLWNITLKMIG